MDTTTNQSYLTTEMSDGEPTLDVLSEPSAIIPAAGPKVGRPKGAATTSNVHTISCRANEDLYERVRAMAEKVNVPIGTVASMLLHYGLPHLEEARIKAWEDAQKRTINQGIDTVSGLEKYLP